MPKNFERRTELMRRNEIGVGGYINQLLVFLFSIWYNDFTIDSNSAEQKSISNHYNSE